MKAGKIASMLAFALMFIVGASFAFAATPGAATVTDETDLGEYLLETAGNVTTEAGNITQANVDTDMSTFRWAGLVGNVTGSIVLGDSNEDVMFEWTAAGNMVYASQAATIDWTSIADSTALDVESAYGYLTTGSDQYNDTFTGVSENFGSLIYDGVSSDFATTQSTGATVWKTYSLTDGTEQIFAGLVSEDGTDYKGDTVDFQMLVPEDGTSGNTATQTYNLWVELQ